MKSNIYCSSCPVLDNNEKYGRKLKAFCAEVQALCWDRIEDESKSVLSTDTVKGYDVNVFSVTPIDLSSSIVWSNLLN